MPNHKNCLLLQPETSKSKSLVHTMIKPLAFIGLESLNTVLCYQYQTFLFNLENVFSLMK